MADQFLWAAKASRWANSSTETPLSVRWVTKCSMLVILLLSFNTTSRLQNDITLTITGPERQISHFKPTRWSGVAFIALLPCPPFSIAVQHSRSGHAADALHPFR